MDNTNLQPNIPSQNQASMQPPVSTPPRRNTPRIVAIVLIVIFIILAGASVWLGTMQKPMTTKKPAVVSIYTRPESLTIAQMRAVLPPGLPIDPRAWNFFATSTVRSGVTDYTVSFAVPQSGKDAYALYANYIKLLNWKTVPIPGLKTSGDVISVSSGSNKMVILFVPMASASFGHDRIATSTAKIASSTPVVATSTPGHAISPQFTMVMIMYEK